ncbi:UNVERIFIED_CONTAM: hypothetical protein Scaly_2439700 [Sesamum calycinum]|uniref:DUF4218 domain-containing protein n=1 Tax=Sesamum calycinum TaxID=2727403 RepID=A0AAW2M2M4_9LAMI
MHKEKLVHENDVMRHPADSELWRDFDKKYPLFADDPRSVRIGLASDGFNPFGNMSTSYSIWPVLVPYNLPPWMCMKDLSSCFLCLFQDLSQKRCYMGHRRFLPSDHKWRDEMKAFDGKKDDRCAAVLQSGEEIMEQLSSIEQVQFEKNVCDNILGTLMNISGKTKDNKRARRDLMDKDGFASNISRCVKEKELTISGLKSHDCHVLLQRLLPLATRGYLHKEVEAKLTGPVQYRWMFPFERKLGVFKRYVRNKLDLKHVSQSNT